MYYYYNKKIQAIEALPYTKEHILFGEDENCFVKYCINYRNIYYMDTIAIRLNNLSNAKIRISKLKIYIRKKLMNFYYDITQKRIDYVYSNNCIFFADSKNSVIKNNITKTKFSIINNIGTYLYNITSTKIKNLKLKLFLLKILTFGKR